MPYLKSLPEEASLLDLRKSWGHLFEKMRPYAQELMRGPSPLSPGQRELIAAYVSGVNSCRYCYGSHARVAEGFGIDAGLLDKLLEDVESAPIEDAMKPLLRYVRKLTETPSRMTETDASAIFAAGWDDDALVSAVAVCAYFNNMNRLVEGLGIEGSSAGFEAAARNLVARGYT